MISGILAARREANQSVLEAPGRADELRAAARARLAASPRRGFGAALRTPGISLIAELKRASPSKGLLREDFPVAELAASYESAGASALSVLTEPTRFLGSYENLTAARAATQAVPILQKDFVLHELQLWEGAIAGADAALLIVNILTDAELASLLAAARGLGIDALVEVRDEAELDRALDVGAVIVGVNHRDLWTFELDMSAAEKLAPRAKAAGVTIVAESGISSRDDVLRFERLGVDAVLVGESIVTEGDVRSKIQGLLGRPSG